MKKEVWMPLYGESFWHVSINPNGKSKVVKDSRNDPDDKKYRLNFFRTKSEAEAARKAILKILRGQK